MEKIICKERVNTDVWCKRLVPEKGDVFFVDLGPLQEDTKILHKIRPCLIYKYVEGSKLINVIPILSLKYFDNVDNKYQYEKYVDFINDSGDDKTAVISQLQPIDLKHLKGYLYSLNDVIMDSIDKEVIEYYGIKDRDDNSKLLVESLNKENSSLKEEIKKLKLEISNMKTTKKKSKVVSTKQTSRLNMTLDKAIEMIDLDESKEFTRAELGEMFGIKPSNVYYALKKAHAMVDAEYKSKSHKNSAFYNHIIDALKANTSISLLSAYDNNSNYPIMQDDLCIYIKPNALKQILNKYEIKNGISETSYDERTFTTKCSLDGISMGTNKSGHLIISKEKIYA